MARIVAQATSGLAPKYVLMTPVEAVRRVLAKTGWKLEDVDLFEINEAFSVQLVAVLRRARHRSREGQRQRRRRGARPSDRRERRAHSDDAALCARSSGSLKRGIAALCLGGGNGVALAIERM